MSLMVHPLPGNRFSPHRAGNSHPFGETLRPVDQALRIESLQHALVESQDTIHLGGNSLIVGRDQSGAALASDEAEELGEDDVGGALVEIAGRLIREHQRRPVRQSTGDCDALLLAARKLARPMAQPLAQAK